MGSNVNQKPSSNNGYYANKPCSYNGQNSIRKNCGLRVVFTPDNGSSFYFNCSAKTLPSIGDAETWTVEDDGGFSKGNYKGVTYVGMAEKIEPFEITIRTPIDISELTNLMYNGVGGKIQFLYTDHAYGYEDYEVCSIDDCYIMGISNSGGENAGTPTTTIRFQPYGNKRLNSAYQQ